MATFTFRCPFCGADRMTAKVESFYILPYEVIAAQNEQPRAYLHSHCGACWEPISVEVTSPSHKRPTTYHDFQSNVMRILTQDHSVATEGFKVSVVRTPEVETKLPPHLSEAVSKALRSAERNFSLPDGEDASATMYRRAIDVALREKFPDVKGNLAGRIEKVTKQGFLPEQMKDWADHIRWIGNNGAHEPEGVTKDELEALRGFADAFLRYLISLPFEVSLRRGEINPDGSAVSTSGLE